LTRPIEATNKSDLGHLEGDTIQGRKCTSAAIVSIRDRLSGVHFYERVSNLKADTTLKGMIKLLNRIPPKFRKTLTLDRGSEFAEWTELEKLFPGLKVYFCDPYCPYQKGGNERGNRDFRKYYPKGTCQFPPFLNSSYSISSRGCSSGLKSREGVWGRLITC